MEDHVLELKEITKTFPGVKALDRMQFQLRRGSIHALIGENGAGKSTLMKVISGIYTPDSGQILLDGAQIHVTSPLDAERKGISIVHQELSVFNTSSVAENIFTIHAPKNQLGMIDYKRMYRDARQILDQYGFQAVGEKATMRTLSVGRQQIVEILRAVKQNAKVLILDEPTSALTEKETEVLMQIMRTLHDGGVSIIYISHRLEEIFQICDTVTIMRDGQYIGTWEAKELTTDMIITKMVGRELSNLYPPRSNTPGEVVFEVKDFTSINPKSFRHVNFNVRKGEILGVAGLVGAQRTELMEGLFGLRCHTSGTITYKGKELTINQPQDAIKNGIAMLTEDRRATGILGVLSIADNVSIASLNKYLIGGIMLDDNKIEKLVQDNVAKLSIKTPSSKTQIQSLSGGNQQKVLIARWLANDPDVFIMDEPTRGIDVGAKYEIYCIIAEMAKQGKSIIMISSEMSELIGMSDRIMVMCDGRCTGFIDGDKANQENIMTLATQFE